MKKKLSNIFFVYILFGFSYFLQAQFTNTAKTTSFSFATIVEPFGIIHSEIDIVVSNIHERIGNITLGNKKTNSYNNTDLNPEAQSVLPTFAAFKVIGKGIYTYAITFTNETEILTNGESDMKVSNFVAMTKDGKGFTGTLSDGKDDIHVGAILTLNDEKTMGTYEGSFSITVAYN